MSELEGYPGFEVFRVRGNPTPEEASVILEAVGEFLARTKPRSAVPPGTTANPWTLSGRLAACRGGILDARTALGPGSWPATARLPWSGRPYEGRGGRGDSR